MAVRNGARDPASKETTEVGASSAAEGTLAERAVPPWYDPGWVIGRTLELAPEARPGAAEDALLAWLVRLPAGRDPSVAAGRLLDRYAGAETGATARRLFALLRETESFTPERLALYPARRRRTRVQIRE